MRDYGGAVFYGNGIDGATGEYILRPQPVDALYDVALEDRLDRQHAHFQELHYRKHRQDAHLGVEEGLDATRLDETGWGVLFASDDGDMEKIRDALSDLLKVRYWQARGAYDEGGLYREFVGENGLRPGEGKGAFLARHGVGPGPVRPARGVPYYLLLVGTPEQIPYDVQYQLSTQFAVGRICFEEVEEYAQYARSVVEAESNRFFLPREAAFFGVRNADDPATLRSTEALVKPLFAAMQGKHPDWCMRLYGEDEASRACLEGVLGGAATPALLFTASHGLAFPSGYSKQRMLQGALLCGDWPGPEVWRGRGVIPEDFYFAGEHIDTSRASLLGLIAFFFSCYGAGTPRKDSFFRAGHKEQAADIARRSFLAALPQRMLSLSRGGALAVVGHVDRAWGHSFYLEDAVDVADRRQYGVFENTFERLMQGYPVGFAMEYFADRYAQIASDLSAMLEEVDRGKQVSRVDVARLWTINNDARSYVIIGDPAVRLPLSGEAIPGERPSFGAIDVGGVSFPVGEAKGVEKPDDKHDTHSLAWLERKLHAVLSEFVRKHPDYMRLEKLGEDGERLEDVRGTLAEITERRERLGSELQQLHGRIAEAREQAERAASMRVDSAQGSEPASVEVRELGCVFAADGSLHVHVKDEDVARGYEVVLPQRLLRRLYRELDKIRDRLGT